MMSLHAQYSIEYSKVFGGSGIDDAQAIDISDDGFIVVGGNSTSSDFYVPGNQGATDSWVMLLNESGDTLYSRTYGGTLNDDIRDIVFNADGGISTFGTTASHDGDIGEYPESNGAWLFTTSIDGIPQLSLVYGGAFGEIGVDVHPMGDGGHVLLAQSSSPVLEGAQNHGTMTADIWVSRVTSGGGVQWANFYGGSDMDIPTRLIRITGGFLVTGYSNSDNGDVSANRGGFDYFVMKLDVSGDTIWTRTYGGSGDDKAYDAVVLADGSALIIGESDSGDGDRSDSLGMRDVWLIRIDTDGNLISESSYGGSDDDSGRRIAITDNGYVITANTESVDGDLNANKGRDDTWVAFIDQNGIISQQMNYGGSLDDFTNGLAVSDSGDVYVAGRTFSTDGNIQPPIPPAQNAWLMKLNVAEEECSTNGDCFLFGLGSATLSPQSNGPVACQVGCTNGLNSGPSLTPGCESFFNASAWFRIATDSTAEVVTITVESDEFNFPQVSLMRTFDCVNFEVLDCAFGSDGAVTLVNVQVDPNAFYLAVVGDALGVEGTFTICASALDVNFCNGNALLYPTQTSLGSPLEGPYLPGEQVQFCYEIPDWDAIDCNGLQGIQPDFGEGWDSTSFTPFGEPINVDTALVPITEGFWDWWAVGTVHYNFTNLALGIVGGQGIGAGWYFTNTSDPPPTDNPDQTTGDIENCTDTAFSWKVCFTLITKSNCNENLDLTIRIKSFADGELGSNVNTACMNDPFTTFSSFLNCCISPAVGSIPDFSLCSSDTLIVLFNSNLDPPVNYSWEVETTGSVLGASPGAAFNIFQQLFNTGVSDATATYSVVAQSGDCVSPAEVFTVTIPPSPQATMSLASSATVCAGEDVTLRFDFTGIPPFTARFGVNGVLQVPFLSETTPAFAAIPIDENAFITFESFTDQQCPGEPDGAFSVVAARIPETQIETAICRGESVMIGTQTFTFGGTFEVVFEGAAENGCDSIVHLDLTVNDTARTNLTRTICVDDAVQVGPMVFTESGNYIVNLLTQTGCDSVVTLDLTVVDQIETTINQVICGGSSVLFAGQVLTTSGTYMQTISISPNCDSVIILTLLVLDNINLTETVIVEDTGSSSGAITIMISGGIPPYSFDWNNGDTTQSITGIGFGSYAVIVTDAVGCTGVFDFFVSTGVRDIRGVDKWFIAPSIISPNDYVNVQLWSELGSGPRNFTMRILDVHGRVLAREAYRITQGRNSMSLALPGVGIGSGLYLVQILDLENAGILAGRVLILGN